ELTLASNVSHNVEYTVTVSSSVTYVDSSNNQVTFTGINPLSIFADDFKKFPEPPEEYYLNKTVRTRGLIKEYKGRPEIVITDPSQIEIVN
ncbi:hypothetical protein LCGC14_1419860, partial [marine sediment metagenome]